MVTALPLVTIFIVSLVRLFWLVFPSMKTARLTKTVAVFEARAESVKFIDMC